MKRIITKINAESALIALSFSYGNPYQSDPREMPGALQHTSISVQISTFFCQEGWGSRGGSGLGGEYGECEWPVIHISLILDFPIDLLKLGDCVLQAQVGRMFAWNQRWFQAKVFGHILLFNLVSFFVFSFVQPDDIIVLGDADLFVVTSPSWFEFVPLKHLFASHQIGSASSPFLFIHYWPDRRWRPQHAARAFQSVDRRVRTMFSILKDRS